MSSKQQPPLISQKQKTSANKYLNKTKKNSPSQVHSQNHKETTKNVIYNHFFPA